MSGKTIKSGAWAFLRWFLVIAIVGFAIKLIKSKDRIEEVVGVWEWGNYTVHINNDDTWGAIDKDAPSYEKLGGSWSISDNSLTLNYANAEGPSAVFVLSPDGRNLSAESAATGVMTKERIPAVASNH